MIEPQPSEVVTPLGRGRAIRCVREGRAWRKLLMVNDRIAYDEGRVSLEHVLKMLGRDVFLRQRALDLDPEGASHLGLASAE